MLYTIKRATLVDVDPVALLEHFRALKPTLLDWIILGPYDLTNLLEHFRALKQPYPPCFLSDRPLPPPRSLRKQGGYVYDRPEIGPGRQGGGRPHPPKFVSFWLQKYKPAIFKKDQFLAPEIAQNCQFLALEI